MKHGEIVEKQTKVGDGHIYQKRVCWCVRHGAIDLFAGGGADEWQRLHGDCGCQPETRGVFRELPKTFKKAA